MQTIAGNRSCVGQNEHKDQTSEVALLKTEMNLFKELMQRQVG